MSRVIELAIRFVTAEHRIRQVIGRIGRQILTGFREAHIQVASVTFEIVGLPPLRVSRARPVTNPD